MADLAFNPNVFSRPLMDVPPDAPVQPPEQAVPSAPVQGEPVAPISGQGDATAIQTGAPPAQPPPAGQQAPAAPPTPEQQAAIDADEMQQQKAADLEEEQQAKILRSHHGNYEILGEGTTAEQHPEYAKLEQAQRLLAQASKGARQQYKPLVDGLKAKINADVKAQNDKIKQAQKVEAIQADAKYEDVAKRDRTYDTVGTVVEKLGGDFTTKAQDRDPKIAQSADFTVKVSPLSTMSLAHKDGTVTYEPLRNAATSIATLNGGIPVDRAVNAVLTMATPYGFDDKTGKPLAGVNGKTGPGARSYQVIGRDVRDNYIVTLDGGRTHLRIDPDTMGQIRQAQTMGWKAAKKWQADRIEAANKPDLITRVMRSVIPGKGF